MRRGLVVLLFALILGTVRGDAQSGCTGGPVTWNATATRAAIAQCVTNADAGDTILIAAGTADFSTPVIVNKNITIRGQGPGQTTLRDLNTGGGDGHILQIQVSAGGLMALRDLTIEEGTGGQGGMISVYGTSGSAANLLIDNLVWEYRRAAHTLIIHGNVRGVISRMDMRLRIGGTPIEVGHESWGGVGDWGDNSWTAPPSMGTADAVYIEDSKFVCINVGYCLSYDSAWGARAVIRFSEMVGPQYMRHGMGTTGFGNRARGTAQGEMYYNWAHDYESTAYHSSFPWNSGWGVNFGNVSSALTGAGLTDVGNLRNATHDIIAQHAAYAFGNCEIIAITSIACSGGTATITAPYMSGREGQWITITGNSVGAYNGTKAITSPTNAELGGSFYTHDNTTIGLPIKFAATCGGTGTGGTMRSPFDGNSDSPSGNGYYCTDAPGRGPGRLITGGNASGSQGTGSILLTDTSPSAQILLPIYQWLDTLNGSPVALYQDYFNDSADFATNRDYFTQVGGSCTGGGACTAGIGVGATLPTTCEANVGGITGAAVAFWKTDEGTWNQETAADHAAALHAANTHTQGVDGRLYRCGGTAGATGLAGTTDNSWVVFYEPYTYPHPLRSGAAPPTNPVVTISSPVSNLNTTAITVDLAGSCAAAAGNCSGVTWVNSNGGATTPAAVLTGANWTITAAALNLAANTFTVTGAGGALTGTAAVSVLRRAVLSALPFTDDCSAASAWPNLGPHYTLYGGTAAYLGLSGAGTCVVTANAFEGYAFTGLSLQSDHYIKARVVTVAAGSQQLRLCVNMTGTPGQTSDFNAYFVQVDGSSGVGNAMIGRYTGGALDQVYASGIADITVLPGTTTVEARKAGTRLSLYVDGDEKTPGGVEVGSGFTGGTAGPCPYGTGTAFDDIEIGNTNATADTTPPVVAITMPTSDPSYNTAGAATLTTLSGTWTDAVGVATCSYTVSTTPGSVAMTVGGGTFTNVAPVPIAIGQQSVVVTCLDAAGNSGTDTLGVFRDPNPDPQGRPVNLRGIFK